MNVGRRVEQAIGNLMALYLNGKVKEQHRVDPLVFMPHEDQPIEEEMDLFTALANGVV